jgi:Prokaryotic RING finger family 1
VGSDQPDPSRSARPGPDSRAVTAPHTRRGRVLVARAAAVWIPVIVLALVAASTNGLWGTTAPLVVALVAFFLGWHAIDSARLDAQLSASRALVEAELYADALPRLKQLQRGGGETSDTAMWLVAQVYDRQGAYRLALESYREYLRRFDEGVWAVEARVRQAELERADGRGELQVQATETPRSADVRCPYCKDGVDDGALRAECAECGTPYHLACYEDSGGCAVYGCRSRKVKARVKE